MSLLPSATEIVYRLGAGSVLVGRSAECDYPPAVIDLPVVMHARRLDSESPSGTIDERVRAVRGAGESLYELDHDRLLELRPDVILTQDLCGVCSVTEEEVRSACRRAGLDPAIIALTPRDLGEVRASIHTVGRALGIEPAAERLVEELSVREKRRSHPHGERHPAVAIVEWLDPPILAGLWAPDQVALAGGRPVGGVRSGEVGVRTSWDRLIGSEPDLVVLTPCSFSVERTFRELGHPPTAQALRALRCPIWIADEAYFSRPGPRLWDGLELLRDLVSRVPPRAPFPVRPWPREIPETAA